MREFSEYEKKIINELCLNSKEYGFLYTILCLKIYSHKEEAFYINGNEIIFEGYYQDNDKINKLVASIIGFYKLIEYLDKSFLILTYKKKLINDNEILEPLEIKIKKKHMTYAINDNQVIELVSKYYNHAYFPSKELLLLVENKFKTQEQRFFLHNKKRTNLSIGIAIFIGLVGIFMNIIALTKTTKIDNDQINQIVQAIEQDTKPIRIKSKSFNETIKAKVVVKSKTKPRLLK